MTLLWQQVFIWLAVSRGEGRKRGLLTLPLNKRKLHLLLLPYFILGGCSTVLGPLCAEVNSGVKAMQVASLTRIHSSSDLLASRNSVLLTTRR